MAPEGTRPSGGPRLPGVNADPRSRITSRAMVVWTAAVLVYIAAIAGRTSFGVAGVDAMERFDVDASRLAVFTAVQVGVYALAQIPVGLAIDRFGPRRTMVIGALVMAAGQILLAVTASYPLAIVARVLIGAGDASAFLSVMRLLPAWFPLRATPLFTQLTAGLGQIGQFLSAVPFLALLHASGWTTAFLALGTAGALVGIAAAVAIADVPAAPAERPRVRPAGGDAGASSRARPAATTAPPRASVRESLGIVLRHPVCWQGFFTHWVGLMHQATFTMLWGMPLMTLGMGLTPGQAGGVLVANTIAVVVAGPLMGMLSARAGSRRGALTIMVSMLMMGMWVAFLLPTTPRGLTAMVLLNIGVAALATSSNLGFDAVRESVDRRVLATATGLANMGGFIAAMIAAQGIGVLLDVASGADAYSWGDFRIAWLAMGAVWGVGMAGLIIAIAARRRMDHRAAGSGPAVVLE